MTHWHNYALPDKDAFPPNYQLQAIIHDSITSTLIRAEDATLGQTVVIKCFKPSAQGAYLREISAAFDIQHPNLARCLTTFHRADGIACIVYAYLTGGSLTDLLKKNGSLDYQTIIHCLQNILNGLIYLHSQNRIHCDIKPDNILLRPNRYGQFDYVLIDLGAACFLREAQEGHHVTGTPAYIAPERLKNKFFFNSDLYSLGVIAFELCTGYRPFTGTVEQLTQANLNDIPSLAAIKYSELRDFIDYLLIKNPHQRLVSATLALQLLNKTIKQFNRPLGDNKKINPQVLDAPQNFVSTPLVLQKSPNSLFCFHVNNYPLIGFAYRDYVDIIDPVYPTYPLVTLLTTQPVQVLGGDLLSYTTASSIQLVNLQTCQQSIIKDSLADLKTGYYQRDNILWSDSYHYFYQRLADNDCVQLTAHHYLFNAEVSILANGYFVMSAGMANNKLILHNTQANPVQEWLLTDPIIGLTHQGRIILAVTVNFSANHTYTLWKLTAQQSERLVLANDSRHIICINGKVFWLDAHWQLHYCGVDMQVYTLQTFRLPVVKLAVCYDHRFIVIEHENEQHKPWLTILNIECCYESV